MLQAGLLDLGGPVLWGVVGNNFVGFMVRTSMGLQEAWINRGLPVSRVRRPMGSTEMTFANQSLIPSAPARRHVWPQNAPPTGLFARMQYLRGFWYYVVALGGDVLLKSYTGSSDDFVVFAQVRSVPCVCFAKKECSAETVTEQGSSK